jgi:hypothetical protein
LSDVTLFAVDRNRKLTLLEGALARGAHMCEPREYIGNDVYGVFNRVDPTAPRGPIPPFLRPLESLLTGKPVADSPEHKIGTQAIREPPF